MIEYLVRRLLQMIPLLLFISVLSFAIARIFAGRSGDDVYRAG